MTLSAIFGDKDAPKVQAKFAGPLGVPEKDVTLEHLLALQSSEVRPILGARLWGILSLAVKSAGRSFAAMPKKPGLAPPVKAISDTWGRIYREETGESYRWDLARRVNGHDWMSRDWTALHEIEPALIAWVRGISLEGEYEPERLQGWMEDEREGPWVLSLAERTIRGFIREFSTRGWIQGAHLRKFSEHLPKYLDVAEQHQDEKAPAAFKPREIKSAASLETERFLEEYERKLAGRR